MRQRIGIIGGSGLYELPGISGLSSVEVDTPYGPPSDAFMRGELDGVDLVFLPRHGRNHHLLPSEVPYRANLWALKSLGVGWVISVSAVGSLKQGIAPGHAVLVDQFIDRTRGRPSTFFGEGVVAHIGFGDPICATLQGFLREGLVEAGVEHHVGGTYVCMEGPAFSTRAESELYRSWGASVVGMTNVPEAKLAREASMSYGTLAFATDYDCWHPGHDDVTVEQVIAVLRANVDKARAAIVAAVPRIGAYDGPAPHHEALASALFTPVDAISESARQRLGPLLEPYLP